MKKYSALLLVLAGFALSAPIYAAILSQDGRTLVTERGDNPSKIAEKVCGDASKHPLFWKGRPMRLPIGKTISIPQECVKKNGKKLNKEIRVKATGLADAKTGNVSLRVFKNLGADPLCTAREVKNGTCRTKQERRLLESGWTSDEVRTHLGNVDAGLCVPDFLPNGFEGDWLANGSETWGKTLFAVKGVKGVEALSCPEVNGKKAYVITQCHNITGRYVKPVQAVVVSSPKPISEEAKKEDGCLLEATAFGEMTHDGKSGSLEGSCQYRINENTTAGLYVRASGGRYIPPDWTENRAGFYPLGIRVRQRGTTFLGIPVDELKGDIAFGSVYAAGGNGVDVEKKPLVKPALWSAGSVRKDDIPITEGVSMTLEGMVFAELPLGDVQNTITWKGNSVAKEKIRPTLGFLVRAGFPGLLDFDEGEEDGRDASGASETGFNDRGEGVVLQPGRGGKWIPEATAGIFFTPGDKNSPGGKLTGGFKNEDETFRVGCGFRWPNVAGVCDAEINWGEQQANNDQREVIAAQKEGATSTAEYLGVTPEEGEAIRKEREWQQHETLKILTKSIPIMPRVAQAVSAPTNDSSSSNWDNVGFGDK